MSKLPHDINDDEIRIISSSAANGQQTLTNPKKRIGFFGIALIVICVLALGLTLFFVLRPGQVDEQDDATGYIGFEQAENKPVAKPVIETDSIVSSNKPFVAISDTTIDGYGLKIFNPKKAVPRLHVGEDILNDSTITFAVQAAAIRKDNGRIVGAYVIDGELLSKGQAKPGYCAIIGGKINIGVAETTPFLEQALETNGYFFRQYPLVVANQVVENKPKGKSLRKALAELNDDIVVIMSTEPLTFHDFSQTLIDLGVSNAINLIGSTTYGYAVNEAGQKIEFGKTDNNRQPYTNYIVWQ